MARKTSAPTALTSDECQELLPNGVNVFYFPVKHHSVSCSHHLRRLLMKMRPQAVLIEGPPEANHLIPLVKEVTPPVAIQIFFVDWKNQLGQNGTWTSSEDVPCTYVATYPFASFSPEWVGWTIATNQLEIPVKFIDLPFKERIIQSLPAFVRHEHQDLNEHLSHWNDQRLSTSTYIESLLRKTGYKNYDDFWEALFEIRGLQLPSEQFMRELITLARQLRTLEDEEDAEEMALLRKENQMRERQMKLCIIEEAESLEEGDLIFVITGALHAVNLPHVTFKKIPKRKKKTAKVDVEAYLVPWMLSRFQDRHYGAGIPYPAYFWKVNAAIEKNSDLRTVFSDTSLEMLIETAKVHRNLTHSHGYQVSTADVIHAFQVASMLSRMRSRGQVGAEDVRDAMITTFIKGEEDVFRATFEEAFRQVFIDDGTTGHVNPKALDVAILKDFEEKLKKFRIKVASKPKISRLDIYRNPNHRRKSCFFHQCAFLGLKFATLKRGPDWLKGEDTHLLTEQWEIRAHDDIHVQLIEISPYGATVEGAARFFLQKKLSEAILVSEQLTILHQAALMGLHDVVSETINQMLKSRANEDFVGTVKALQAAVLLLAYKESLGLPDDANHVKLIKQLYRQVVVRIKDLTSVPEDQVTDVAQSLKILVQLTDMAMLYFLDQSLFHDQLELVFSRMNGSPMIIGVAAGVLHLEGIIPTKEVIRAFEYFARGTTDPEDASEFLEGLFLIDKTVIMFPRFLRIFTRVLLELVDEIFLTILPGLRKAFAQFIPREINHLSKKVADLLKSDDLIPSLSSFSNEDLLQASIAQQLLQLDQLIHAELQEWGFYPRIDEKGMPPLSDDERNDAGNSQSSETAAEILHLDPVSKSMAILRWRLVLGRFANQHLDKQSVGASLATELLKQLEESFLVKHFEKLEETLEFLYGREYRFDVESLILQDFKGSSGDNKEGGSFSVGLTIPRWLEQVDSLFPRTAVKRIQNDAIERYGLKEVLLSPQVLDKLEPNIELAKILLTFKNYMEPQTLKTARRIVFQVVKSLEEKMRTQIERAFHGVLSAQHIRPLRTSRNFDFKRTIRKNLKHYNKNLDAIIIEQPYFHSKVIRKNQWRLILVVDQSGSMTDTLIHSAIMASIFWNLDAVDTRFILFDTRVVDLSDAARDPLDLLFSIQLGGGTAIGKAMAYARTLVEEPSRTMIVLVTDFYEGGLEDLLLATVKMNQEEGIKQIGLITFDQEGKPDYHKELAEKCAELGMEVGVYSPQDLTELLLSL